jgi:PAS domain S-box-containing protein
MVYLGQTHDAAAHAEKALALGRRHDDRIGQAEADLAIALNAVNQADMDRLAEATKHSLTVLEGVDRPDLLGEALLRMAMLYRSLGHADESATICIEAMDMAERSGSPLALTFAHHGMAVYYEQSGRSEEAIESFRSMREYAQAAGTKLWEAHAISGEGSVANKVGNFATAEQLLHRAIAMFEETGSPFAACFGRYDLASSYLTQHHYAEAINLFDQIATIYTEQSNRIGLWWTLKQRSSTHLAAGDRPRALADAERARALAVEIGLPLYRSESARQLASIAADAGEYRHAYALSSEADDVMARATREKSGALMLDLAHRYRTESKQREINELTRRNAEQTAELHRRAVERRLLWTLFASCAAGLLVAVYAFLRIRHANRALARSNAQLSSAKRELEAAERAVRSHRERLATIFNVTDAGFILFDAAGHIVESNAAVERILGLTRPELLQPPLRDPRWKVVTTEGHIFSPHDHPALDVLQRGIPRRGEVFCVHHPDGRLSWVSANNEPILDNDGRTCGVVSSIIDITAQRTAELALRASAEQFRAAFDQSVVGMALTSLDHHYLSVNRTFATMLGHTPEALVGRRVSEMTHPDDIESNLELATDVANGRREQIQLENRYLHRSGRVIWARLSFTAVRDATGSALYFVGQIEDITDQKAALVALQISRERLQKTLQAVAEGIVVFDRTGRLVDFNPTAVRIVRVTEEQLRNASIDRPVLPAIREDGRELPPEQLPGALALRDGTVVRDFVHGVCPSDGPIVWLSVSTELLRDAGGIVEGVVTSFSDITGRRSAEADLRQSRERLATIFNVAEAGFLLFDAQGRVIECNAAMTRIFGLTRQQVFDPGLRDPRWKVVHHRAQFSGSEDDPVHDVLRTGRPRRGDIGCVHHPDGRCTWMYSNDDPVYDAEGHICGVVASVIDITAQRAAEQKLRDSEARFRLAFDHSGIGMAIASPITSRFLRVNRRFADFLGCTEEELVGRHVETVSPRDDYERTMEHVRRLLAGEIATFTIEKRYFYRDRRLLWGQVTMGLVRDAEGRPSYTIAQIEDITERKKLEAELRSAHDEALEASRHKSEFLASMSHEIRTPMNGVLGTAEMLATTELDAKQRAMSRVILQSARTLLRIIDDILDLSRVEAGKLYIGRTAFQPAEVIEDAIALMRPLAEQKGLRLAHEIDAALVDPAHGDPLRLRQVLTNLLSNAIKFTLHGCVELTARTLPAELDSQTLVLRIDVRDTGLGVPAAIRPKLFQPFVQAEGEQRRHLGGTGLGLAISRHLVTLMNGKIGFSSAEGVGSTFWFELPLSKDADEACAASASSSPMPEPRLPPPASAPPRQSLRLLVVEDNEPGRFVARLQLEHLGHTVDEAEDGVAALEALAEREYDALLMDCDMPRLDGFATTRRIRSGALPGVRTDVRIIALTAFAMPNDRARCLTAGMDDHLPKPLTAEALERVLARSVPRRSSPDNRQHAEPRVASPNDGALEAFDRNHLARLAGIFTPDGRALSDTYVAMCLAEIPPRLDELAQLSRQEKTHELARMAHSLAGSAANLGAHPLRSALKNLESAAHANNFVGSTDALTAVRKEWRRLQSALLAAFPQFHLPSTS